MSATTWPVNLTLSFHKFPYPTKESIKTSGLKAKKQYGQHFICMPQVVLRCAALLAQDAQPVIEIGPGPGALTWAVLTHTTRCIFAVEKDRQFKPFLETLMKHAPERLCVWYGDFFDYTLPQKTYDLVGNLPYNRATQIIFYVLQTASVPRQMIFMLQKEVAQRLCASPHSKNYGRLTVMLQWCCRIQHHFDVLPQAFWPVPQISSAVVSLVPDITAAHQRLWPTMSFVTQKLFSQRRKMLRGSLSTICKNSTDIIKELGWEGTMRPENLYVSDFEKLALILVQQGLLH